MVDFQARDTRRAPITGEEDETEGESTVEDTPDSDGDGEPALSIAVIAVGANEAAMERAVSMFQAADHSVATRKRVTGGEDEIRSVVETAAEDGIDIVVTTGGIGVAPDEETIEGVRPLFDKELPGFGEAFRRILHEYIGSGIVTVRSTAGVVDRSLVFCLPGHADAAQLAIERLITSESPKLLGQLR